MQTDVENRETCGRRVDALVGRLLDEDAQALFDAETHRIVVRTESGVVELCEYDVVEVVRREPNLFARLELPIPLEIDAIAFRCRNGNVVWSYGRRFDLGRPRSRWD